MFATAQAIRPYKQFLVELDWIPGHRTLRVQFEERITRNTDRTYTKNTTGSISDDFIRGVLEEIFNDLHVRDITVKHRALVIHHNGSAKASLECRVLSALRAQGKDVVEKK